MIEAEAFIDRAREAGFGFYTGVPCSFLTPFINGAINNPALDYVPAASEGEAIAIAAGAYLSGRASVAMCQNSGLGNMVNPLTSLTYPFRIPILLIVTWRGQPGLADEPQHELMGAITHGLLATMRIPQLPFPTEDAAIEKAISIATEEMRRSTLPFAFVQQKGNVADFPLRAEPSPSFPAIAAVDRRLGGERPSRYDVLTALQPILRETAVIATTGKTGRELFTVGDSENQLYLVGSMGCAGAVGLGVALNSRRKVVVFDGDGAALMKLGAMSTVGHMHPDNLIHIVLDNGVHDSTGGQETVSSTVDFAGIAAACSYATARTEDTIDGLVESVKTGMKCDGPHFVHMKIKPGSITNLGRPTVSPDAVARRFRNFLETPA